MRVKFSLVIKLLVLLCLSSLGSSQDFDFNYLVQQWPPSYCDTRRSCCFPTTGKPDEDFGIHGLWPNYNNGTWPENCNGNNNLNLSQISDLISRLQKDWPTLACPSADGTSFWNHEWVRHGTCTSLDQHTYFQDTLDLKIKSNLLHALTNAGIVPGNFYSVKSIKKAIKKEIGYKPYISCNVDLAGNQQLFEVYLCVDKSATKFINCPIFPNQTCKSTIEFPSYASAPTSLLAHL